MNDPGQRPQPGVFRAEAYAHYLRGTEDQPTRLKVSPPWTWALLWAVLCMLAVATILGFAGWIEVNTRATAILRPAGGMRSLDAPVGGTVRAVHVAPGQTVRAGDPLVSIDSPGVRGELLQVQREIELIESDFDQVSGRQAALHSDQVRSTRSRMANAEEQLASLRTTVANYRSRWEALASLAESQVVSRFSVMEARESYDNAARQLSAAEQQLEQVRQELARLEGGREMELWNQRQALDSARSREEAIRLRLAQAEIRAPEDGLIDALLIKPGDAVPAGSQLGRLVPVDVPLQVVSFLPEKDRAFVREGDTVRLELEQLPYSEFGSLGARVLRISDSLATSQEVEQALGDGISPGVPTYRVELEITDTSAASEAGISLRTGMLMKARFTLRRQRPVTVMFEPLRRWLD